MFRASTTVVPLTVAVLDRQGRPIADLAASDFSVFEDGSRREIVNFFTRALVPRPTGDVATAVNRTPARAVLPAGHRRFLIVLGHGRIQHPADTLDGAIDFVSNRLLPQDAIAVMAVHRTTAFTTDHSAVLEILRRFKDEHEQISFEIDHFLRRTRGFGRGGPPVPESMLASFDERLFGSASAPDRRALALRYTADLLLGMDTGTPAAARPWQRPETFRDVMQSVERSGFSLNDTVMRRGRLRVLAAIEYMRYRDGEKHILVLARDPIATNADDARSVAARANDARVVVNYVFTAGTSLRGGHGCPSCDVAELTGGAYTSVDVATNALAAVDSASRSSYLLGYAPADAGPTVKYRQVRVLVNRPGAIVRFRHGYFPQDDSDPVAAKERIVTSRLQAAFDYDADARDLRVGVEATTAGQPRGRLQVTVEIDQADLAFETTDGVASAQVELKIFCGDTRSRQIGSVTESFAVPGPVPGSSQRRGPVRRVVSVPVTGVPRYVKVVAYDYTSDRIGSKAITLPVR